MTRRNVLIMPDPDGGWRVRLEGEDHSVSIHETQAEAIAYGRQIAERANSEVIVQGAESRAESHDPVRPDTAPGRD